MKKQSNSLSKLLAKRQAKQAFKNGVPLKDLLECEKNMMECHKPMCRLPVPEISISDSGIIEVHAPDSYTLKHDLETVFPGIMGNYNQDGAPTMDAMIIDRLSVTQSAVYLQELGQLNGKLSNIELRKLDLEEQLELSEETYRNHLGEGSIKEKGDKPTNLLPKKPPITKPLPIKSLLGVCIDIFLFLVVILEGTQFLPAILRANGLDSTRVMSEFHRNAFGIASSIGFSLAASFTLFIMAEFIMSHIEKGRQ